jgi:hypothetical protein
MHCPNCGNEAPLDQKFCRRCGFNLAPVGDLMRTDDAAAAAVKLDRAKREALMVRHMFRWMAWGMGVLGIGVLMIVADKAFDFGNALKFVTALVMLGGIAMATYGVMSAMLKRDAGKWKVPAEDKHELQAPTTRQLAGGAVPAPVPSVTERTTELIGNRPSPKTD